MSLTGAELIDEVKSLVGRDGDIVLMDSTRVRRWLNEGQRVIAEQCPGLNCTYFKNTTSVDTTQVLAFDLTDVTVGDSTNQEICHVFGIWYLDGNESVELIYIPVDEFDNEFPDPTHSDFAMNKPKYWTRRGQQVEMYPLCATSYCDKDLRIDGNFYPEDVTATTSAETLDLSNADDGVVRYAVAQAWGAIGREEKFVLWQQKFNNWLEDYRNNNNLMPEWGGNLFGDGLE